MAQKDSNILNRSASQEQLHSERVTEAVGVPVRYSSLHEHRLKSSFEIANASLEFAGATPEIVSTALLFELAQSRQENRRQWNVNIGTGLLCVKKQTVPNDVWRNDDSSFPRQLAWDRRSSLSASPIRRPE